ncbi:MAG TPA: STAS domain-containing protein [bacterium]|nr:STAS domain-containing protein [bacterium]
MSDQTPTSLSGGLRLSVAPSAAQKDVFVVRVDGTVDTLTADELDNVIGTLVRQKRTRLVIDLAGAQYISSAGWGIFISRLREAREGGGDLKLARMTAPVRDVYNLLELEGVLLHFDGLDAAEAHFQGGNGHGRAAVARPVPASAAPSAPAAPAAPAPQTVIDALRQLILEDPFYSIGELRARLAETGSFRAGRWAIFRALWSAGLALRRQRFRYYRRQMHGSRAFR